MKITDVSKSFIASDGNVTSVFNGLNLSIEDNKVTCIMGPSGCGKTTLLNIIAGLIEPDSGYVDGRPEKISYLFQDPRLLGWKTASENIELVSDREGAAKYLKLVDLEDKADSYPDELSGGQRQRVAIARALAFDAPVVLMDEPFQNLDEDLRYELLERMVTYCRGTKKTVVWVTHDSVEADKISDRIIKLQ